MIKKAIDFLNPVFSVFFARPFSAYPEFHPVFLSLSYTDSVSHSVSAMYIQIGLDTIFALGAVLCIVGCVASSLVFYSLDASSPPHLHFHSDNQQCLQALPNVPWEICPP